MKILLINPIIVKRNFAVLTNTEPIMFEYLAAMVMDNHEVEILDGLPKGLTPEQILESVKAYKPDIIGISVAYSTLIKVAKNLSDAIKKEFPDIKIILGGNAATFTAKELIHHDSVDILVLGEGENTFKHLIDALDKNTSLENIPALCFKTKSGEIKFNDKRPLIEDLDSLPLPAHNLLKDKKFYERTVLTTRGCPYNCVYCSTSAFFQKHRKRSVPNIMKEVRSLFEPGLEYSNNRINFIDDIFTIDHNRVKEICNELTSMKKDLKLDDSFQWTAGGRIENITEDLLKTMKDGGCSIMFFGIESGSQRILDFLKRRYTQEDVVRVINCCKKLGIFTLTNFIVGLPHETKEDIDLTFSLIAKLEGHSGISMLTAFPGTDIFNDPAKYNLTVYPHEAQEDDFNQNAWVSNGCLTREEIVEAHNEGIGVCIRKGKKRLNISNF